MTPVFVRCGRPRRGCCKRRVSESRTAAPAGHQLRVGTGPGGGKKSEIMTLPDRLISALEAVTVEPKSRDTPQKNAVTKIV